MLCADAEMVIGQCRLGGGAQNLWLVETTLGTRPAEDVGLGWNFRPACLCNLHWISRIKQKGKETLREALLAFLSNYRL